MVASSKSYDVFISYASPDRSVANDVAETLRSYGLEAFLDSMELPLGADVEEVIWEAMAESRAVVVVASRERLSANVAFELGAARAWNKPMFVVSPEGRGPLPNVLQGATILPVSRVDEIARCVRQLSEPISAEDEQFLTQTYVRMGAPVDQLALQPQLLGKLAAEFNRHSGRHSSNEDVLSILLRLRKRARLPPLKGSRKRFTA